jgi:hypothetical protein
LKYKTQEINIPPIRLHWSKWFKWERFLLDPRTLERAIRLPNSPGVYELKYENEQTLLTIGEASSLRKRVKQGLIKGNHPHSTGKRIRKHEDPKKIVIRWAETKRPSAVEEELHRRYIETYGDLPKHTIRTEWHH